MAPMSSSSPVAAIAPPKPGVWVANVGGRPRILWRRVLPFVLLCALAFATCLAFRTFRVSPFPAMALGEAALSGMLALVTIAGLSYQIVAIEIERQRVLSGNRKPKIGLAALMMLIIVVALPLSLLGREYRAFTGTRRAELAHQQFIADAKVILSGPSTTAGWGGNVQIDSDGGGVDAFVYRPSFDNADLAKLLRLSKQSDPHIPITGLILMSTQVDAAGLRQLADYPELIDLTYTTNKPDPLDDETIDAILESLPHLRGLSLDEPKLQPGQLDRIRERFPNLIFNSYGWKNRDLLKQRREAKSGAH
jgi:hypothetical protein